MQYSDGDVLWESRVSVSLDLPKPNPPNSRADIAGMLFQLRGWKTSQPSYAMSHLSRFDNVLLILCDPPVTISCEIITGFGRSAMQFVIIIPGFMELSFHR